MSNGEAAVDFLAALDALLEGHTDGWFAERRWGVTLDSSPDRRRRWLYAEAFDGSDRVSFNLYALAAGWAVRPCEMFTAKIVASVLGYTNRLEGRD